MILHLFNNNDIDIKLEEEKKINNNLNYYLIIQQLKQEQDQYIINNLRKILSYQRDIIIDLKTKLADKQSYSNKCVICLLNDLSFCCIPCGHTYCHICIEKSYNCFICKKPIIRIQKIFIS